jgi:putative transposase
MSTTRYYPTDVTEEQGALLAALLPERQWQPGGPGRPPYDRRCVIQGMLYLLKTGCQGRLLPREVGQGSTSSASCNRGRREGVGARVLEALRQLERQRGGRPPEPSAGSVASQSLKTATQGEEVGVEGGKKSTGRKRQLVADTLGRILAVGVPAADQAERLGLVALLSQDFAGGGKRLRQRWVEGGSQAEWVARWGRAVKPTQKIDVAGTGQEGTGFQVSPWRWAVERTFAWLLNDRRHSRDYEGLTVNSEALIQLSMIRLLLNRLA